MDNSSTEHRTDRNYYKSIQVSPLSIITSLSISQKTSCHHHQKAKFSKKLHLFQLNDDGGINMNDCFSTLLNFDQSSSESSNILRISSISILDVDGLVTSGGGLVDVLMLSTLIIVRSLLSCFSSAS